MKKEASGEMTPKDGLKTASKVAPIDGSVANQLRIGKPYVAAAGMEGVYRALEYSFTQAGARRTTRLLTKLNQKRGYDCPSCAWPDPDDRRHLAEFCENGAKAVADEGTTRRITPEFFARHSIAELTKQSDYELGQHGRLTQPVIKKTGSDYYEPIQWEAAFDLIARTLNDQKQAGDQYDLGANKAVFYTSGRTSNEAAFVYQLLARLYGTNNLPDCSNMCHESSGTGLTETIGVGKGTVTLEDIHQADCLIIMGQNPGTNHPRMLTALQIAARNGCEILSINPLREAGLTKFDNPQEPSGWVGLGTKLATQFIQVRINGDVAFLKGVMKDMLETEEASGGVFDQSFIEQYTDGVGPMLESLRTTSWSDILNKSGLSRETISRAAKTIMKSKRMIVCWAMGITQHKNGVANVQEIVNLLLLGGHLGRTGAGVCPVRGHSNVQGDRTMGIFEKMPDSFLDALEKEFKFSPPRKHGFHTVDAIKAMNEGKISFFLGMGGNFLVASPDTRLVANGLRRCALTVQVSTKLNRSHLVTGDAALILPCLGRTEIDWQDGDEQYVTVEDSMGKVHASRGTLQPGSEFLKSEIAIICGIGAALFRSDPLKRSVVDWRKLRGNYDLIRKHIGHVVKDCGNYNERSKSPDGFYLANAVRDERVFLTSDKKAHFTVHPLSGKVPSEGRYLLMTIRSHDQFNTTIYGLNDRYRGVYNGRRVILMNSQDIQAHGLTEGASVDITSHFPVTEDFASFATGANSANDPNDALYTERCAPRFRVTSYDIPRGCVAVYYPEGNVLASVNDFAEKSFQPVYKSIEVSLRPSS